MNITDHVHDHHMHHHEAMDPLTTTEPVVGHVHSPGMTTMDHGMDHMMMMMYFHFGTNETILFNWWKVSSAGGIIGSCIGIFLLSTLYECLKYYRDYLYFQTNTPWWYRSMTVPAPTSNSGSSIDEGNRTMVDGVLHIHRQQPPPMLSRMHIFQTFLHAIQIIISYFLMLIFMTYNVWLCLAVLLGGVTGYFLFGWKKSVVVDVTEHCH